MWHDGDLRIPPGLRCCSATRQRDRGPRCRRHRHRRAGDRLPSVGQYLRRQPDGDHRDGPELPGRARSQLPRVLPQDRHLAHPHRQPLQRDPGGTPGRRRDQRRSSWRATCGQPEHDQPDRGDPRVHLRWPAGGGHPTGGDIRVTGPIFGQTQYDTAEAIDTTPPSSFVGTADLSGAYSGAYNHTSGAESSAPSASGSLRTAIVATGANFPDAIAGSVLAYNNHFPIVLTDPSTLSSQASTVLQALGIQQVILLGGPLAVSDTVVSSIQALGISVIRVAGVDQTDTAQELASLELNSQTTDVGLGWSATWGNTILVARGDFYSDALAGCVLIAHYGGGVPLLETLNPSTVGQYLTGFLNAGGSAAGIDGLNATTPNSGNIQTIQPLGGSLALNATTLTTMANAVAAG